MYTVLCVAIMAFIASVYFLVAVLLIDEALKSRFDEWLKTKLYQFFAVFWVLFGLFGCFTVMALLNSA